MTTSNSVPVRPLRIVIPGGSGQVGRILARRFQQLGGHVVVLTRGPHTAEWETVHWDGQTSGLWTQYLEGADVCINLAGRSVNCRYTPENRVAIYNSRIVSTQLLGEVIASLKDPPRVWLNASTATIYRHALDRPMDEKTGELGGGEPGSRALVFVRGVQNRMRRMRGIFQSAWRATGRRRSSRRIRRGREKWRCARPSPSARFLEMHLQCFRTWSALDSAASRATGVNGCRGYTRTILCTRSSF